MSLFVTSSSTGGVGCCCTGMGVGAGLDCRLAGVMVVLSSTVVSCLVCGVEGAAGVVDVGSASDADGVSVWNGRRKRRFCSVARPDPETSDTVYVSRLGQLHLVWQIRF